MKRVFLTLLIIFNLTVTANHTFAAPNENDDTLKGVLEALYEHCGSPQKSRQYAHYSDFLQEMYNLRSFSCDKANSYLKRAINTFEKESKNGYAYIYVEPEQEGVYDVKLRDETIPLRVNNELMWMISKKNPDDARLIDIYALSFSESEDGLVNGTVSLITKQRSDLLSDEVGVGSNPALLSDVVKNRKKKFVLEGWVSPEIADSCYNIYMANMGESFTENDLVARVLVKDKRFRYETELDNLKKGRIRALFPGDKLCSAWIEVYFIPGFTLEMTVQNGSYTIHNKPEYDALVNEWLVDRADLSYRTKIAEVNRSIQLRKTQDKGVDNAQKRAFTAVLTEKLENYDYLLNQYRNEIGYINTLNLSFDFRQEEVKKRLKKMEGVTENMEKLINEYVEQIE